MFSKKVHIGLFLVGILLLSACSSKFMKLQKNGTTEDKYKAAMEYYKKADYYRSGLLFEEIIPLLKGVDSTAEYAQFYNAYCQYYQRQYQMSSYLFKTFYSTYANSPLADEAFYMSAFSMYKDAPNYNLDQTSTLTAIDALQTYINTFPESKYAEECNKNLKDLRHRLEQKAYEKAKLYYKTRTVTIMNLKAAVVTIQNFERDFPDSEFIEELAYLKVQAQYELAQVSFEDKQKERYGEVVKFYEKFVDGFPKSKYLKQAEKSYDGANKAIEKIVKAELEAKALKEKEKTAAKETEKLGKN